MSSTAVNPTSGTSASGAASAMAAKSASTSGSSSTSSSADASSNFLTLLVTQMQNQDPLNPMDNAQVTSQLAQINTVTGINQLNTTVSSLNSSFSQLQVLQASSLVGHQVQLSGDKVYMNGSGNGVGGFSLPSTASSVQVTISDAAGNVVGTVKEGALSAGNHSFTWTPPAGTSTSGLTFAVKAANNGQSVTATPYMTDVVQAVNNSNGALSLELQNSGSTAYSSIQTFE